MADMPLIRQNALYVRALCPFGAYAARLRLSGVARYACLRPAQFEVCARSHVLTPSFEGVSVVILENVRKWLVVILENVRNWPVVILENVRKQLVVILENVQYESETG